MAGPDIKGGRVDASHVTVPAAPGTRSPTKGKPPVSGTRVASVGPGGQDSGTSSTTAASLLYDQKRASGPTAADKVEKKYPDTKYPSKR